MADEDLEALLLRTAEGDEMAFAALYTRTAPRLFAVCRKMLGRHSWAEEVLQEAYVRIWHNAGEFNHSKGGVLTWMISVTRYRCIDFLRLRRVSERPLDDADWAGFPDSGPGPLELAMQEGDGAALRTCLETLSADQRQSIVLAFFDGLTHEELCRRLKKPIGTVKSWVRRGIQNLKRCLQS